MKRFEERSPRFQRWSDTISTYVFGGISMAFVGLFILAGIAGVVLGVVALLHRA